MAEHPVGGGWGTPTKIVSGGMYGLRVAVGPDGTVAAAYTTQVSSKLVVNAVVRPAGAGWGSAVTLSDTTKTATSPHVAVGAGVVTAVWVEGHAATSKPMVNTRPLGVAGTWGSAITFVDTGVSGIDVAASAAGTLVTWVLSSDPTDSYAASTFGAASTAPPAPGWHRCRSPRAAAGCRLRSRPLVPTARWRSRGVRLAGTAGEYLPARALAAIQPPGGAWATEALLSDPGIDSRSPHVGVGPDGTTTVVWRSYDGATDKIATRTHRGGSWAPSSTSPSRSTPSPCRSWRSARMAPPS